MAYGSYRGGVFAKVDVNSIIQDPSKGRYFCTNFAQYDPTGLWVNTAITGAAAVTPTAAAGLRFTTTSTTDQGAQLQATASLGFAPVASKPLHAEAQVRFSDIDAVQFYMGLATVDTSMFATGSLSTTEDIGLYMDATSVAAAPGKLQFRAHDATGTDDTLTEDSLLVTAATWHTIGFILDYDAIRADLYFDGQLVANKTLTAANLAAGPICPSIAALSEGSTASTVDFRYVRYYQDW